MSELSDIIAQTARRIGVSAVDAFKPHIVITAPDGEQLWVPVSIPTGGGSSSETSLWPNGFKLSLVLQDMPQSETVTDSAASFLASHSLDLLKGWLVTPSKGSLKLTSGG